MRLDQQHWEQRLAALTDKHGVPGASLAICVGEETASASHGVLNLRAGIETTTDSLFQIGSITKVWTATLVMQLVDEGRLDLDEPIVTYLPTFTVGDSEVAERVSARHLLSHTSGIDGDLFVNTGNGNDAIEKYVAACATLGQTHPIGATMSYCNSGYSILGRVIEVLCGETYDRVLHERLFTPLGITSACLSAEQAILHRVAVGHMTPPGEAPRVVPVWGLPRGTSPAGAINMTPSDVMKFAKLHLNDGVAGDGTRVVSTESAQAMREPQVEVPDPHSLGSHWGLGWILMNWDGHAVYGHDGATLGQGAMLRVCPDAELSVCLAGNGGHLRDLYHDVFSEIFADEAGIGLPARLEPPAKPLGIDLSRYAGRFVREGCEVTIEDAADHLVVTVTATGSLAEALSGQQEPPIDAFAVEDDLFVMRQPGTESWTSLVFYRLADGSEYVHFGARATPRVS